MLLCADAGISTSSRACVILQTEHSPPTHPPDMEPPPTTHGALQEFRGARWYGGKLTGTSFPCSLEISGFCDRCRFSVFSFVRG